MSLGLCCQYVEERKGQLVNLTGEQNLQLGRFNAGKYSDQKILDCWINNLNSLDWLFTKAFSHGIKLVRISSNVLPLWDKISSLHSDPALLHRFQEVAQKIKDYGLRVTCHPSQFCVLTSNNSNVIDNSIALLKYHAWIFDKLELTESPFNSLNIHGGVKNQTQLLLDTISNLPPNVKKRLTLENDEIGYSCKDLYLISEKTEVPIVFDSHHHTFNDGDETIEQALQNCIQTWGNIKPITHLSNTEPHLMKGSFKDRRKHGHFCHSVPDFQKDLNNQGQIDIEMEFKAKNLALLKAVEERGLTL